MPLIDLDDAIAVVKYSKHPIEALNNLSQVDDSVLAELARAKAEIVRLNKENFWLTNGGDKMAIKEAIADEKAGEQ